MSEHSNTTHHSGDQDERRFAFGANWQRFLELVDDQRIAMAKESLTRMLHVEDLKGKSFLDAGSGSGRWKEPRVVPIPLITFLSNRQRNQLGCFLLLLVPLDKDRNLHAFHPEDRLIGKLAQALALS